VSIYGYEGIPDPPGSWFRENTYLVSQDIIEGWFLDYLGMILPEYPYGDYPYIGWKIKDLLPIVKNYFKILIHSNDDMCIAFVSQCVSYYSPNDYPDWQDVPEIVVTTPIVSYYGYDYIIKYFVFDHEPYDLVLGYWLTGEGGELIVPAYYNYKWATGLLQYLAYINGKVKHVFNIYYPAEFYNALWDMFFPLVDQRIAEALKPDILFTDINDFMVEDSQYWTNHPSFFDLNNWPELIGTLADNLDLWSNSTAETLLNTFNSALGD